MTDKQIIIDGYDVSECLFYQSNFEEDYDVKIKHFCSNWHNSCESANNSNCYFKQLKRKEQECEQIKEKYEALKLENEEGYEIVAELKHECEELKERLERIEEDLKYQCVDCMNVKSDRYCKALEEIEKQCKCYGRSKYTQEFDREYGGELDTNILDIITKAKDGNNAN